MKYIRLAISGCFIILSVILISVVTETKNSDYADYSKRFVFAAPLKWPYMSDGIKTADEVFGTNTKLTGSDELDIDAQIRGIENAIRTDADGIITASAAMSRQFEQAIQKAHDAGIPVVLIDGDMPESNRNCYIGTNNIEAGRMAGEEMAKAANGSAEIAIVTSEIDSSNQKERVEGFMQVCELQENMNVLEILECHSDSLEIVEKVSELLEKRPEINSLYLTEGTAGIVVGNIIKNREQEMTVVAFDAFESTLEYLKEGIYDAIIDQSMYEEGYMAVEVLCQILDGKEVEDTIYTEAVSITAENYLEYDQKEHEEYVWYDN